MIVAEKTAITPFLLATLCGDSITYCVSKVSNGNHIYEDAYIEETLGENYSVEQLSELCYGIYDFSILQKIPIKGEKMALQIIKRNTGDYSVHYFSLSATTVKKRRPVRINGSQISDSKLTQKILSSPRQNHRR